MPTASFDHQASAARDQATVWERLQQPDTWKSLGGIEQIANPKTTEDGLLQGFEFTTSVGGMPYRGVASTVSADVPRSMVVDIDTTELRAQLTVGLDGDEPELTVLEVAMRLTSKSFLASMMWGLISTTVGSGLGDRVDEVIALLEAD